jgi:hypothetical protein
MKQQVQSLIGPFCIAEALEEGAADDHIFLEARPEEEAEEGKP